MVKSYIQSSSVKIIYYKNEVNLGADLNYLKAVEIAKSDYCWLMGSDDLIIPGSISRILNQINESGKSVYMFNRRLCDINMKFVRDDNFYKIDQDKNYNISYNDVLAEYFNDSISLGAVFSYLSSIVLKKVDWEKIAYDSSYTGTLYSHVFIILSFLKLPSSSLKVVQQPPIYCRMDNDAFLEHGALRRFLVDIDGYTKLANDLYKDNKILKSNFLNILKRQHSIKSLLKVRVITTKAEWTDTAKRLRTAEFDDKLVNFIGLIPSFILLAIRKLILLKNNKK